MVAWLTSSGNWLQLVSRRGGLCGARAAPMVTNLVIMRDGARRCPAVVSRSGQWIATATATTAAAAAARRHLLLGCLWAAEG